MKSISIFICVLILFSLFFSCQNIENENVIARVGNCELTTFDYSKTYSEKILNTGIVDSDFERERHLNQLIRLKLFADASMRDDIALDSLSNKLLQIDSIKIIKDTADGLWVSGIPQFSNLIVQGQGFVENGQTVAVTNLASL